MIFSGADYSKVEEWKSDLLLMLNGARGPGRGLRIGKNIRFFLLQGHSREEAKRRLAFELPKLAAAEILNRERNDLAIRRLLNSEILYYRVDIEMTVSNLMVAQLEATGQVRPGSAIIVPGEKGAEKEHPSEAAPSLTYDSSKENE